MEKMEYGRQRLKDIVEKEAEEEAKEKQQEEEEEAKEQQQDDNDEQYDTAAKIKLVYEGKRVKEFKIQDWRFKQIQHKDDHSQHHTTHWDEGKGNVFI